MITTVKTCFKCGVEKPLTEFYKHSAMADGHLNKCKECAKVDIRQNRANRVEYYRSYDIKRGNRQGYGYTREYRERFPKKYAAHTAINNAVNSGKLSPSLFCEVCGDGRSIVGHHDDYDLPLSVRWLCQPCHVAWHKINGEGKNANEES